MWCNMKRRKTVNVYRRTSKATGMFSALDGLSCYRQMGRILQAHIYHQASGRSWGILEKPMQFLVDFIPHDDSKEAYIYITPPVALSLLSKLLTAVRSTPSHKYSIL
ncbi:hypothetical protein GDO78_004759 [Eleutherodactylus coqui]|uniref:Uncharacterized protein n=1 Tax=Eleutherodactylus coqui TaxID=57060 RepID=A0A8J6ETQ2_ELECQ|nr:hypothetical protein GDO78_004759 [Eleutherodactylus coqui]